MALSPAGSKALLAQVAVCEVTGVKLAVLCGGERGDRKASFARQIAMYLCRMVFAMTLSEVAESFGRDRTTAAHAVARIEEAREEPEFDRAVTRLEGVLRRLVREIEWPESEHA